MSSYISKWAVSDTTTNVRDFAFSSSSDFISKVSQKDYLVTNYYHSHSYLYSMI